MSILTNKRHILKLFKICFIILIIILLLCGFITMITRVLFVDAKLSAIACSNGYAQIIGNEVSLQLDVLQLPENETVFLMGEYDRDRTFLLVYANNYLKENIFLYGDEVNNEREHWVLKISDLQVEEVWCGERPIAESELHAYTEFTQGEQCRFVTFLTPIKWLTGGWLDTSDLIGYYRFSRDSSVSE